MKNKEKMISEIMSMFEEMLNMADYENILEIYKEFKKDYNKTVKLLKLIDKLFKEE